MMIDPSCSMYKKHLLAVLILDTATALRIPISPFALIFSTPPTHVHLGGPVGDTMGHERIVSEQH
jgi:hypothetical protein